MIGKIVRYCFRCKMKTGHHMHNGLLRCSLCVWKKFKPALR
jgi:hypothetical protein